LIAFNHRQRLLNADDD